MKRLERLLDLVHVLQSARRPVSFEKLKDTFSDYAEGSDDAVRRKFERDKAELSNIGLVIEYDEDGDEPGYRLNMDASYLPEVELSESERALLTAATKNALADEGFPYRGALRVALAKLGDDAPSLRVPVAVSVGEIERGPAGLFETIATCLAREDRLWIRHQKPDNDASERLVDPHGVFLKSGSWYLAGHDHRTGGPRVFELRRIVEWRHEARGERVDSQGDQRGQKSATDDPDERRDTLSGRRLTESLLQTSPLFYEVHAPLEVTVRVDAQLAFMLPDWGEPAAVDGVQECASGTANFVFSVTNKAYLIDQLLALGPRAEVLAPASLRRELSAIYRAVADVHSGDTVTGSDR